MLSTASLGFVRKWCIVGDRPPLFGSQVPAEGAGGYSCLLKLSMAMAMSRMLTTPLLSTSALEFQLLELGLVLKRMTIYAMSRMLTVPSYEPSMLLETSPGKPM